MHFTKIKYDGKKVELAWTVQQKSTEITHTLTSSEKPLPALPQALNAFNDFVETLLEVQPGWMDNAKVTGLSINTEEDGRSGLVVTSQRKLADTNAPLVINTPHLREPTKLGEEGPGFLPDGVMDLVDYAERAAEDFVKGKRSQGNLFDEPAKKDEPVLAGATAD